MSIAVRFARCLPGVLGLLVVAAVAMAGETRWWTSASPSDYEGAESRGVLVHADGTLTPGPRASETAVDSATVIWTVLPLADGSVALGCDGGRILRWTARGVRPWVTLDAGQVLSLAIDGDGVIAGTGPEGLIYRVGANGDTLRMASTGERYVWGLVPAPDGWWAATGTAGRLLRLARNGDFRIVLDTEAANIVALIDDGSGGVYLGTDDDARVIHMPAKGAPRTLFDAPEEELRALARGADGAIYAAALSVKALENGSGAAEGPAPRAAQRRATPRDLSIVYRIVPDSSVARWWVSPAPAIFALAPRADGLLVATGNRAGLYHVESARNGTRWLAPPQAQITSMAVQGDVVFAATSNPAALWRVESGTVEAGELTSPVFDAERIARFGRLRWDDEGNGRFEFETRTGNSDPPDTTWSPWQAGRADDDGMATASPSARHFQWKLRFRSGRPLIRTVEVAWRENNLAPTIDQVRVLPQGRGMREGRMNLRSEPITQELPDGRKVEFSLKRQERGEDVRSLPAWLQGLRVIEWSAADPNDDPLRYVVEVSPENESRWTKVAADIEDSTLAWDTRTLADGRYRLRVTASDASANPLGEGREATAVSGPLRIDNTAPEILSLEATSTADGVRVSGRARDEASEIARVELAVDDAGWRIVTPDGGFADGRTASFSATLRDLDPGYHAVSVRVSDRAGNASIRSQRVRAGR